MRQLGLATMQYVQDFDEYYPPRSIWINNLIGQSCPDDGSSCIWVISPQKNSLLTPYAKDINIGFCPSQANKGQYVGYGYNRNLFAGDWKMSAIASASEMLLFVEDTLGNKTAYQPSTGQWTWAQNFSPTPVEGAAAVQAKVTSGTYVWGMDVPFGRHLEGVNVTYCDGHVKFQRPLALYNNGNDKPIYDGR